MFQDNPELFGLLQLAIQDGSVAVRVARGEPVDPFFFESEPDRESDEQDHDEYEFQFFTPRHEKSRRRHYMRKLETRQSDEEPNVLARRALKLRLDNVKANLRRHNRLLASDVTAAEARCFILSDEEGEEARLVRLVAYLNDLADESKIASRIQRLSSGETLNGLNDDEIVTQA